MNTSGALRIRPAEPPPSRFAYVPRQLLWAIDGTPCPCGARFGAHEWVLTEPGMITVLACSREALR